MSNEQVAYWSYVTNIGLNALILLMAIYAMIRFHLKNRQWDRERLERENVFQKERAEFRAVMAERFEEQMKQRFTTNVVSPIAEQNRVL